MNGDKIFYKYTSEKSPGEKINYSYSEFGGEKFIEAWRISRDKLIVNSSVLESFNLIQERKTDTEKLFYHWIELLKTNSHFDYNLINLLLKRFEVTKKVYENYNEDFRPMDKGAYENLRLYVLFAYILVLVFEITRKLQYLNSLLKINDIIYENFEKLSIEEKKVYSFCILIEKKCIEVLRNQL